MTTSPTANISPMQIATSRFGILDAPEEQLVEIDGGLLGFPDATSYVRIPVIETDGWLWLQSVDDPELAFLAISAFRFFADYDVDLSEADAAGIDLAEPTDAEILALVTVSRSADGTVDGITANLLGPVVINTRTAVGRQIVLAESPYSTREPVA
jgi:flagellar assembly factor FliW